MKHTFTLYIHANTYGGELIVFHCDMSEYGYALICTKEVELDVPEFDIVQIQVDGIDKQIAKVRAESERQVTELTQRKQELLAIGCDAQGGRSDDICF